MFFLTFLYSAPEEEYNECACIHTWHPYGEYNATHSTLIGIGAPPLSYPTQFTCTTNFWRSVTTYTPCIITGYVGGSLASSPVNICTYSYKEVVERCRKCTDKDTSFPKPADNQQVAFTWKLPEDRSSECSAIRDSEEQQRRVNCEDAFRCLVPKDKKECDETVGSYVSPSNGVFHEDIEVTGADFGLHYSSANVDDNSIAYGWSISSHAKLVGNKVYFGSGSLYVLSYFGRENNFTLVASGSNEMLFDDDGKLVETRDLYSKETKTTFGYDNTGRLRTVTDMYGQITTLNRDANGTVTSIVAPQGQTTYLLEVKGDNEAPRPKGARYLHTALLVNHPRSPQPNMLFAPVERL